MTAEENGVVEDFNIGKIRCKVREAQLEKIPYMLVIVDKEQTANTVAFRSRTEGDLGVMSVGEFAERLAKEEREKKL